jgi:SET domain-containing protein
LGVFAAKPVCSGEVVSRFMPPFDTEFPAELLAILTEPERNYLRHFAYRSKFTRLYILTGDNDRYMNHCDHPNVAMNPDGTATNLALRDISAAEELTCDYRTFDAEWELKLPDPCSS